MLCRNSGSIGNDRTFKRKTEGSKHFFVILSGLAAIIALCGIIEFITSMFRSFRYYFSFDTFFWILSSLLLTLTIMAAVVGITYTLLHLSGSTPDLSNITGVIGDLPAAVRHPKQHRAIQIKNQLSKRRNRSYESKQQDKLRITSRQYKL